MPPVFSTVTLPTDDLDRALAFCTTTLGFEVDARYGDLIYLATGPIRLALYPRKDLATYVGVAAMSAAASVVVSLELPTPAAVDHLVERAIAAGAHLTRACAPFAWGGYGACFRDPDGHLWEVVHAPARSGLKM